MYLLLLLVKTARMHAFYSKIATTTVGTFFFFIKAQILAFGTFLTLRAVTAIHHCHQRITHGELDVFRVVKETFLTQNCVWPFQEGI